MAGGIESRSFWPLFGSVALRVYVDWKYNKHTHTHTHSPHPDTSWEPVARTGSICRFEIKLLFWVLQPRRDKGITPSKCVVIRFRWITSRFANGGGSPSRGWSTTDISAAGVDWACRIVCGLGHYLRTLSLTLAIRTKAKRMWLFLVIYHILCVQVADTDTQLIAECRW